MEFSVKKFDLLDELSLTQGVVERKTTIPILSNLLFEVQASRLTITATDLELSIRTSCEAKVKKEGAGTIPAKKLLELVRLLPDEEIRFKLLKLDDSRLAIAIEATFAKRAPHAVPHKLEPPPSEWGAGIRGAGPGG
jgi:DNA polymerase III sliding clamp (beta) subunit (PCNA family)